MRPRYRVGGLTEPLIVSSGRRDRRLVALSFDDGPSGSTPEVLEVLDEFDLALMAAERKPNFEQFLHGVELVYAKLQDILRSEGLERIDAEGKPFDPERHEALMQAHDGDGEPYVADVLRQGYMLKGRVIRPAGVKVGRK